MAVNDNISDLLAAIRNGQLANLATVRTPVSKGRKTVLDVLVREGFVKDYKEEKVEGKNFPELVIGLKYYEGKPVIREMKRISKPGRRVYASVEELPKVSNGLGISIISTSKGVMADHEARVANVGGEVLCEVL